MWHFNTSYSTLSNSQVNFHLDLFLFDVVKLSRQVFMYGVDYKGYMVVTVTAHLNL